eukprot:7545332-Heterocapsa_arctica.AAC.1
MNLRMHKPRRAIANKSRKGEHPVEPIIELVRLPTRDPPIRTAIVSRGNWDIFPPATHDER